MIDQYVEDNRMYFWSTIGHPDTGRGEETQLEVDMGQVPVGGMLECIVMTGVHKGETRMMRALNLMALYEQQQEEEEE